MRYQGLGDYQINSTAINHQLKLVKDVTCLKFAHHKQPIDTPLCASAKNRIQRLRRFVHITNIIDKIHDLSTQCDGHCAYINYVMQKVHGCMTHLV